MRFNRIPLRRPALVMLALGMAGMLASHAAKVALGSYNQRIYYPPPNDQKLRTELNSTDSTNIPDNNGRILIWVKNLKIKEYALTGELQLTAETPECILDYKSRDVWSDGPLQARTMDGRMFVEGTGFFLSQTHSSLAISNQVHSIFELQAPTNGAPAAKTEVWANRGDFRMKSESNDDSAIYRGDVRLKNPRMKLASEWLTADLPRDPGGRTNRIIVAETNVILDFVGDTGGQIHATSQKAVYNYLTAGGITNEIVELTRNPRVELTNGWMTADGFFLNLATDKMQARDNVHFHFYGQMTAAKTNSAGAEIFCDVFDYDLKTRQANFTGNVRENDEKTTLAAEFVTTILPKNEPGQTNNQLDHLLAQTNVVIEFQDSPASPKIHAIGQQAVYDYHLTNSITNQTVTLTGNPAVQTTGPEGWMTADTIIVDNAQRRVWGAGNHHSIFKGHADEPAAMDSEIFSDRFDFAMATGIATYYDNVRVYDSAANLTGKTGLIKIAQAGTKQTNYYVARAQMDDVVTIAFLAKAFSPDDITNLDKLAGRLRQPPDGDGVARFIAARLSQKTGALLTNYHGETNQALKIAMADDFNRIIRTGPIYDAARFDGVYLSITTTDQMRAQPLGVDLVELNRQLLLDAFRNEINRNPNGEIIYATGDHGIFTQDISANSTNRMIKLEGHPRVEQPNGTLTADDFMTADLITGKYRLAGNNRFTRRLIGVDTGKLSGMGKKPAK